MLFMRMVIFLELSLFNYNNFCNLMADVREQRIYCAEQIVVPDDLPNILKHYSKAVIR
jgi:hypothetical protein